MENLRAVLTADVVKSKKFDTGAGKQQLTTLLKDSIFSLRKGLHVDVQAQQFFRGDSFQLLLKDPRHAVVSAMYLRACLRAVHGNFGQGLPDARVAIGVGTISYVPPNRDVGLSDGHAFRLSGQGLDKMRASERLVILTPWEEANRELAVETALVDAVIQKWTPPQARAMSLSLAGTHNLAIADALDVSPAAISQRLKLAGENAVGRFIERWKCLLEVHHA